MRCPKCHYISFDSTDRCRNCGYEFSLSIDAAAFDLPIQTGDEAIGPMADFALGNLDAKAPEPPAPAREAPPPPPPAAEPPRRAMTPAELPLFTDRAIDDDTPLVSPSAVPRPPLAVRRSSPAIARAQRASTEEPAVNLELPNLDDEPEPEMEPEIVAAAGREGALYPVATLASRLGAGVIDGVLLGAIDAAVVYFTLKICGFSLAEIVLLPLIPLLAFLLLLNGGYVVAFIAAGGQTIGKMAAGIKVIPADGEPGWHDRVPLGTAFLRAAALLISIAPAGAGLLPALFAADHRAVHDRLAHTRVVKA